MKGALPGGDQTGFVATGNPRHIEQGRYCTCVRYARRLSLSLDRYRIPNFEAGGAWVESFGQILGVGADAGIKAMFVVFGLLYLLAAQGIILYPRLRRIELEIPDAVSPEAEEEQVEELTPVGVLAD